MYIINYLEVWVRRLSKPDDPCIPLDAPPSPPQGHDGVDWIHRSESFRQVPGNSKVQTNRHGRIKFKHLNLKERLFLVVY